MEVLITGNGEPVRVVMRGSSVVVRECQQNIKALFARVRTGTPGKVLNQPVNFSVEPNGIRYVEVHRPLSTEE
ncbi:hypothetical protein [Salmonella enterica]|uniref:hypothetical protein n=1 Tax=Salmonella enterica TaxID=28901 RepID=UPI00398C7E46